MNFVSTHTLIQWMHINVMLLGCNTIAAIQHEKNILLLLKRIVDDDVPNVSNPRMPLQIFISKSTIKTYTDCFCCLLVFLEWENTQHYSVLY